MMDRRFWIAVACTVIAAFSGVGPVYSQSFPSKPVRLITGFPAGGPTDLMARILGEKLQATWKQPVVVEAKPGASGIVSMELLKNAPPDGYLLLVAPTNTLGVNPHLFPKLPYDPVRDFTLIARVADMDNLLVVNAGVSAKTLQELAALARSNPSKLTFGSPANGSQAHIAGEFLNLHYSVKMTHVPYKGVAPAVNDLLGGQITMMFATVPTVLPHVRSGKLRAIALPARKRNASIPDVPTFAEQGVVDFEAVTWFLLIGPAGIPAETVAKIRADSIAALQDPGVREKFRTFGAESPAAGAEDLDAFLRADLARWGKVIRAAGIKAD
ncbi:MAG: tripartite tricarboxylate transporter substrate binding protein [Betaproteobacteria bacterium]|nr:tripartite tricarboxylate transporter substrate binding protein [Betaproteobacteria bacterium]